MKKTLAPTAPKRAITSASNFFRRVACPGSYELEAGLAEVESEYSGEGNLLHPLFLTGKRPDTLTIDQKNALDLGDMYAQEHFANVRSQFKIPEDAEFVDEREVPLEFQAPDGTVLMPGHADVIRTWPKYDVRSVVDAKYGWKEVEHAADNWQLGIYAAMRYQRGPSRVIAVCISQPRNFGPRKSEAIYLGEQMPALMKTIVEKDRISKEDGGKTLVAGEKQCHYCRAKSKCPAYTEKFLGIQGFAETAISQQTNDKLVLLHRAIAYANKIKDEVNAELRYRIEQGTLPGWKLQSTGDDTDLIDALGLFKRLTAYFDPGDGTPNPFTAVEFDRCRSMEWGRLVALIQKLTGLSEKKCKEFVKEMADGFVIRKPKAKRAVIDKSATPALEG